MTGDWLNRLKIITQPPETMSEALDRLMNILSSEQKLVIALMSENELAELRLSLGMAIQNAFGLLDSNSKLLAECGVTKATDATNIIITELWRTLQN